jgi:DNA polymerase-3 subunit alpha
MRRVTTKKGDTMLVLQIEDESGGPHDLVAFPKAYEKYKDVLVEEALLRVQAKVERDRRGEGVQLLLETALMIDPSALPAEPRTENPEPRTENYGTMEPQNHDQRNERKEQGNKATKEQKTQFELSATSYQPPVASHQPATEENSMSIAERPAPLTPQAADTPAEPVSVIRPRAKAGSNGNGHGAASGQGNGSHYSGQTRQLLLYMPIADDYDQAIRLMQQVRILLEHSFATEAGDEVIIKLPSPQGTVILKPRDMVTCTPSLLDGLREVLGSDSVVIADR